jgi:hypothetical protein
MTTGFWRACGLALLLLFVQQLTLTHALEHIAADVVQLAPEDDAAACPECLALGGLQPGATTAGRPWSLPLLADEPQILALAAGPSRRPEAAHAIRAPPENRN